MPGIRRIGLGSRGGASWTPQNNSSLWWDERDGGEVDESIKSLPAEILLPVAKFNGTDNCIGSDIALAGGQALDIEFEYKGVMAAANVTFLASGGIGTSFKGIFIYYSSTEQIRVATSSGTALTTALFQDLGLDSVGKNIRCRIQWDGTTGGTMTCEVWSDQITIQGVGPGPVNYSLMTSTLTTGWVGDAASNITIGASNPTTPTLFWLSTINYVKIANVIEVYLNGLGLYEYDVLGNTTFIWQGAVGYSEFNEVGSEYYLTNGYRRFINGALVEYVPDGAETTVIEAAGYTLAAYGTHSGVVDEINMFPCLVDMNPTGDADVDLAILDRSDVTYQTAVSRDADDYDATNPFRYRIETLADPRIHSDFFNVGYAGTFYSKIRTQLVSEVYYIKSVEEMFLTSDDKTGADQVEVLRYCRSNVLAI